MIEQHRTGLLTLDRSTTVAAWLERWYAGKTSESENPLRPTTARSYRAILDAHLIPRLGALRLADLRAEHVEKAMRDIKRDRPHLSAASRRGIYAVLRSAMNKAVQKKALAVSLVRVRGPRRAALQ